MSGFHRLAISGAGTDHPAVRADARLKLVAAVALLAMVLTARGVVFPALVGIVCVAFCLSLGVRPKTLLFRFSEPVFVAAVVLVLKFLFSGTVPLLTFHLAGIELVGHRDGLSEGVRIGSRILASVSVLAAIGFATPFTELMAALSWMKVPQVLVDVALFAWRYLFLLFEDAQVVYQAQRNRLGYAGYRRGLRSFGTLAGVLVIKAFDNSQQITTAMIQRGYDGDLPLLRHRPFVRAELLFFFIFLIAMGAARSL
jgi:cobalt/nickel transport system permease protein